MEGRKRQTQRIVDHLSKIGRITEFQTSDTPDHVWSARDKRMLWHDITNDELMKLCPYGQPGGRLWVKENFVLENTYDYHGDHEVPADGRPIQKYDDNHDGDAHWIIPHYQATECALEDGMVITNELHRFSYRRKELVKASDDLDPFTKEEQILILRALTGQARNLVQFALWTGLRTSEYIAPELVRHSHENRNVLSQ